MSDVVLVATDGGRMAASALRFAARHGEADNAPIEIVAVVEPLSDLPMPLPHREELEQAHARGVAERVREHLRDVVGPVGWPIHVRVGRPAPSICQAARARRAGVIILGVDGRKLDGNNTALELLHLSEIPVIVARDPHPPRVALAGIDFRPSSVRAAREAARLIGPDGVLHLAHIEPALDFPAALVWDWSERYGCAVAGAFQDLVADLAGEFAGEIQTHTRMGEPVAELLQLAEDLAAGVLAIGSDGYICNGRVVVGRVARHLVSDAPVSLLATPVRTVSADMETQAAPSGDAAVSVAATPAV